MPEDLRALQEDPAPADRDVVGAGDADAVGIHGVPRRSSGPSSGFQSLQYRTIEFLLGNKNAAMLKVFAHDAAGQARAAATVLESPSLYDEFLRLPRAQGPCGAGAHLPIATGPSAHVSDPGAAAGVRAHLRGHRTRTGRRTTCARTWSTWKRQFQLWRFRHMRTVMRIIGFKRGTGGSSGVGFLKQALELTFFPELFEVRTSIGPGASYGRRRTPPRPEAPWTHASCTTASARCWCTTARVLLGRRANDRDWLAGAWDVFGGHIEAGESAEAGAACASCDEELGIVPLHLHVHGLPSAATAPEPWRLHLYLVTAWQGEPRQSPGTSMRNCAGVRWARRSSGWAARIRISARCWRMALASDRDLRGPVPGVRAPASIGCGYAEQAIGAAAAAVRFDAHRRRR